MPRRVSILPLLDIHDLSLRHAGAVRSAVDGVSFSLMPGEALNVVGPSGAGKSALAAALMGLEPGAQVSGRALWSRRDQSGADGAARDLLVLAPADMRALRGREIAMIYQDPAAALNPVLSTGRQVGESMRAHLGLDARTARARSIALLKRVGMPDPEGCLTAYPHQLSGGLRQRVTIAAALSCGPRLLIADEPTTALDAPLRAGILDLLNDLRRETGLALLMITHDMRAVRRIGGRVAVMDAGRIVEDGPVEDVLHAPRHATTRALIDAARPVPPPQVGGVEQRAPLLQMERVSVRYGRATLAVRSIDLSVAPGETLALVGASGCGKSTLARAAMGLERVAEGNVRLGSEDIAQMSARALHRARARIQMVFQDPVTALDPRRRLGRQVADPLRNYGHPAGVARIAALFAQVGLAPDLMERFAHEVSGGQRQRAAIARALALDPDILVVDEGLSALDSVQAAGILRLLRAEQDRRGLAMLFITHDLHAARAVAHRIAVMDSGRIVETGGAAQILTTPAHPRTRALIAASELDGTPGAAMALQ
ncbi:ABC transporter ATP-binding protein [Roseovarius sp. Pro17]|uniref:ABC transporter ATP-binding protein n=1 Tax=Roseovarius sp. Pro17 TaxID=3108175 RepID=UPI002D77D9F8|nr:ABC transporter ATP-binding protein [Roseovarius sp. Pro17]